MGLHPSLRKPLTRAALEQFARERGGQIRWETGAAVSATALLEVQIDSDTRAAEVYTAPDARGHMTMVARLLERVL